MPLASLTDTQGIVALAAGALAVVALLACLLLWLALRGLKRAQTVLLGGQQERDLIGHAAELQLAFNQLRDHGERLGEQLGARIDALEGEMTGAIAHRALVRYDAYNEHSGQQSLSIALLDETRSGIVLSCIHHRDQARVYAKQIRRGQGELELSPEEEQAVREALARPLGDGASHRS